MSTDGGTLVVRETAGTVAVIRLADGPRRNALSRSMVRQLRSALADAAPASALAIVADGPHFCSGGDHAELAELSAKEFKDYVADVVGLFTDVAEAPVPVVVGMQGAVIGGGVELALQADLLLAADDVWFHLPQVAIGGRVGAASVRALLARSRLGFTRRMLLLSERVSAEDAFTAGLVDRVVRRADLRSTVEEVAGQVSKAPACAVSRARASISEAVHRL
jgi:enoyl-CoA hydratase/carnithine racemase